MTKELCFIIEQISRDKGISKDTIIKTLESALLSAARKKYGGRLNVDLRIDPKTCAIKVFETKKIVESVTNSDEEVTVEYAAKNFPDKALGEEV